MRQTVSTEITPENSVLSLGATQMIVANLGSPDPGSDSIRLPLLQVYWKSK